MGYASIKKFAKITDEIGLVIDGCGNTHEQKYYYNGAYVDLCGLSIKDYMYNPCQGGSGSGSGGGSGSSKPKNNIKILSFVGEDGHPYYQAIADYPVTSTVKIKVESSTGTFTELDIYAGETESKPEIAETVKIESVNVDVTADDYYEYNPTINGEGDSDDDIIMNEIFVAATLASEIITADVVKGYTHITMENGSTFDLTYTIPGTDVNYYDMEETEFLDFCNANQYMFLIALPSRTYNEKNYVITNYGNDITKNFKVLDTMLIDDVDYTILVEKAGEDEDIMPFVPLYNEDITFDYKLTLNK